MIDENCNNNNFNGCSTAYKHHEKKLNSCVNKINKKKLTVQYLIYCVPTTTYIFFENHSVLDWKIKNI